MVFPTPSGGSVRPSDFAPSIFFSVLYGCLLPLIFYRLLHRRSRTLVVFGCVSFAIERIVLFSLRAHAARTDSNGPLKYMEITIGVGFLSICSTYRDLVKCFLINATYGTDTFYQAPAYEGAKKVARTSTQFEDILSSQPILEVVSSKQHVADTPRARFISRRFGDVCSLLVLAAIITGILGATDFPAAIDNTAKADNMMMLRYVSAGLELGAIILIGFSMIWGYRRLPRASTPAFKLLVPIWLLLCSVAIYRVAVLHNTTSSLSLTGHGSLNSPADKTVFYIFQILAEWFAVLALFGANTREVVGCGLWGDWRGHDETDEEKSKRIRKEEERAQRKAEKQALKESADLRSVAESGP
ncbi:hypothetical protein BDN71DRAFT_1426246 [Pleurotus eryngii]|uniref:Uncharacterized protein n=1 Tax=Pleurotus eryngii TaxID=5323 RepID=A0A9P6A852_PLEER|nr:hypothetical protein BDN71DRAFT_1426246 [Pleurotus eryngii]